VLKYATDIGTTFSLKRASGTLHDKLITYPWKTHPYRNTKHYITTEMPFPWLFLSVYVCMYWCRVHPHHTTLGTAFFHHMSTLINPLGMGLRCSLASSLEIICLNPHRRDGVVIPSNPQKMGGSKICYVALNGLWVYYIYQLIQGLYDYILWHNLKHHWHICSFNGDWTERTVVGEGTGVQSCDESWYWMSDWPAFPLHRLDGTEYSKIHVLRHETAITCQRHGLFVTLISNAMPAITMKIGNTTVKNYFTVFRCYVGV
jgi:hypothetical protein